MLQIDVDASYSLFSHVTPKYPSRQEQMKVSMLASVQVPPFTHGLLEHAGHGTETMNKAAKVLVKCLSNNSPDSHNAPNTVWDMNRDLKGLYFKCQHLALQLSRPPNTPTPRPPTILNLHP